MRHNCLMKKVLSTVRPKTYDAIIEAAFITLNADPTASLEDIANRAGVGRATLHRHFNGRDDLIETLHLVALKEVETKANEASAAAASHTDALKRIMTAMIPLGDRHWFLAQESIGQSEVVTATESRHKIEFSAAIEKAKKEGAFHKDCPTPWIATTYDHLIHAAWEMVREGHVTHKQAANLAWATLIKGLKQAKL